MWALICKEWGGFDRLQFEEFPEPDLVKGSVRIRVKAAGVNFADSLIIEGKYQVKPILPFVPGLEVSGEVIECALDVRRVKQGDRVLAIVPYGGYAEQVVALETDVFVIPNSMDYITAAAFPVVYGTSHIGLKYKLKLKKGETLLVNGAAGGVGLTAVELAKEMGAVVIAAASSKEKLEIARNAGADHLIDYKKEDVRGKIKIITNGKGVDTVYDPVGGVSFNTSLRSTAQMGRILIVGFASGVISEVPANILLVKNISVIGYYWGAHRVLCPDLLSESFFELFGFFEKGKLKPYVFETYELEDGAKAIEALKLRQTIGKLVIKM